MRNATDLNKGKAVCKMCKMEVKILQKYHKSANLPSLLEKAFLHFRHLDFMNGIGSIWCINDDTKPHYLVYYTGTAKQIKEVSFLQTCRH